MAKPGVPIPSLTRSLATAPDALSRAKQQIVDESQRGTAVAATLVRENIL